MLLLLVVVGPMHTSRHALAALETTMLLVLKLFIHFIYLFALFIITLPSRHTKLITILLPNFLLLFLDCLLCKVLFNLLALLLIEMEELFTLFNHILLVLVNENWLHDQLIESVKVF